ncbi:hypothetical protein [Paraburkholderia phytofirmans]|uniref:Uncharacterized protein n=1 Tax=Paraburkholderia phytofirmans TaxID=261302 RepID=A0ABW9BS00_9BURK
MFDELPEPVEFVEPVDLPELPALVLAGVATAAVDPFELPVPPPPPQPASKLHAATIKAALSQHWKARRWS